LAHQALWFDGERAEAEGHAPRLGEHSRAILAEAGLSELEINCLFNNNVLTET